MNAFLAQALCLTCLVSINIRADDLGLTRSSLDRDGESGVMTQGTIFDINSNQIVILSSGSENPIRYSHGEGTVYVDESGDPITFKVVKSGVTAIVFYSQTEDQRMANRVIVGKSRNLPSSRSISKKPRRQ